jgi:hypothetical protein
MSIYFSGRLNRTCCTQELLILSGSVSDISLCGFASAPFRASVTCARREHCCGDRDHGDDDDCLSHFPWVFKIKKKLPGPCGLIKPGNSEERMERGRTPQINLFLRIKCCLTQAKKRANSRGYRRMRQNKALKSVNAIGSRSNYFC